MTGSSGSPSNGQLGDSAGRPPWELFIEVRVGERLPSQSLYGCTRVPTHLCAALAWRRTRRNFARCLEVSHGVGPRRTRPFDADAARAFGQVAASLRRSGRKATARAYDAMIAAVALANGLPLYTCNPDDFSAIDGLTVVAVTHPDHSPAAD